MPGQHRLLPRRLLHPLLQVKTVASFICMHFCMICTYRVGVGLLPDYFAVS